VIKATNASLTGVRNFIIKQKQTKQ